MWFGILVALLLCLATAISYAELSYDLNAQVGIWRLLRAYSDQVQFIVASHSLFALKIPDAHYIDLSSRYLASSEAVLELLQGWPQEKPKRFPQKRPRPRERT